MLGGGALGLLLPVAFAAGEEGVSVESDPHAMRPATTTAKHPRPARDPCLAREAEGRRWDECSDWLVRAVFELGIVDWSPYVAESVTISR